MPLTHRPAGLLDAAVLGGFYLQLQQDEQTPALAKLPDLVAQVKQWLGGEYEAALFFLEEKPVGYALYKQQRKRMFLKHFFVSREHRRQGLGRQMFQLLQKNVFPPGITIAVEVLASNERARAFWKSVGLREHVVVMQN